jgi:hypothetical protein
MQTALRADAPRKHGFRPDGGFSSLQNILRI